MGGDGSGDSNFATSMGGDGSGDNNFATSTIVASLCSLVSVALKEEKENDKQRGINKDKEKNNCSWGPLGN
jgi:hypothetical protein